MTIFEAMAALADALRTAPGGALYPAGYDVIVGRLHQAAVLEGDDTLDLVLLNIIGGSEPLAVLEAYGLLDG